MALLRTSNGTGEDPNFRYLDSEFGVRACPLSLSLSLYLFVCVSLCLAVFRPISFVSERDHLHSDTGQVGLHLRFTLMSAPSLSPSLSLSLSFFTAGSRRL